MIRLGLCCIFVEQPIKFRTVTAANLTKLNGGGERGQKISGLCLHNLTMLREALAYCLDNHIGAFRVQSGLFPLKTHPVFGYNLEELPEFNRLFEAGRDCREYAAEHDIRISFHPDQFVVLSSPHPRVLDNSFQVLFYQNELAEMLGGDVINLHCGGVYGDKKETLRRLVKVIGDLSDSIRGRLTLENDDRSYTPDDLIPLCKAAGVPFVYDVHHHRCMGENISVEEVTEHALATWNREPMFHVSSPVNGWNSANPCYHSDYIDYADIPDCWKKLDITIDVEAKAKELAVKKLYHELTDEGVGLIHLRSGKKRTRHAVERDLRGRCGLAGQ